MQARAEKPNHSRSPGPGSGLRPRAGPRLVLKRLSRRAWTSPNMRRSRRSSCRFEVCRYATCPSAEGCSASCSYAADANNTVPDSKPKLIYLRAELELTLNFHLTVKLPCSTFNRERGQDSVLTLTLALTRTLLPPFCPIPSSNSLSKALLYVTCYHQEHHCT